MSGIPFICGDPPPGATVTAKIACLHATSQDSGKRLAEDEFLGAIRKLANAR
jgi:hypothetical protein